MALTPIAKEFWKYCDTHDFISLQIFNDFKNKLEQENNKVAFEVGLEKFLQGSCPNCNTPGAYKWHFMGKLKHPDCGWTWYLGPGKYVAEQLKAVFRAGFGLGSDMHEPDKKGEGGGCLGAIFGFILGFFVRLPFALLMIPIQAVVSLTQQKPDKKESSN